MFEIKLINPHIQFGKHNCSLLFHDTLGEFPDARWEKKYPEGVTRTQVIADVKQTLRAFAEEQGITWSDAKANGAEITVDRVGGTKTLWQI